MDEIYMADDVRDRLIQSGLRELSEHGLESFSLRRVAIAAGVSCAAPYRHFKDKDELVLGIIGYVREGWELLSENVAEAHGESCAECIKELSRLLVHFWVGNGNFRSILMLSDSGSASVREEIARFDAPLIRAISAFSREHGLSSEDERTLADTVLALVYGTLIRVSMGSQDRDTGLEILKNKITNELVNYIC